MARTVDPSEGTTEIYAELDADLFSMQLAVFCRALMHRKRATTVCVIGRALAGIGDLLMRFPPEAYSILFCFIMLSQIPFFNPSPL